MRKPKFFLNFLRVGNFKLKLKLKFPLLNRAPVRSPGLSVGIASAERCSDSDGGEIPIETLAGNLPKRAVRASLIEPRSKIS